MHVIQGLHLAQHSIDPRHWVMLRYTRYKQTRGQPKTEGPLVTLKPIHNMRENAGTRVNFSREMVNLLLRQNKSLDCVARNKRAIAANISPSVACLQTVWAGETTAALPSSKDVKAPLSKDVKTPLAALSC